MAGTRQRGRRGLHRNATRIPKPISFPGHGVDRTTSASGTGSVAGGREAGEMGVEWRIERRFFLKLSHDVFTSMSSFPFAARTWPTLMGDTFNAVYMSAQSDNYTHTHTHLTVTYR